MYIEMYFVYLFRISKGFFTKVVVNSSVNPSLSGASRAMIWHMHCTISCDFLSLSHVIKLHLACVAVVSVSFKQAKHERRARALGKKEQKKVGAGGRGGEGKETPAAEPRHFSNAPK